MKFTKNWHVGHGADTEILRYDPEQSPPTEDIDAFVAAAKLVGKLRPFQCMRYVLRDVRWTSAWLKAYVAWHVEDLNATFVKDGKSFYIALLESPTTGDRSVAFRLTTAGLGGLPNGRYPYAELIVTAQTSFSFALNNRPKCCRVRKVPFRLRLPDSCPSQPA